MTPHSDFFISIFGVEWLHVSPRLGWEEQYTRKAGGNLEGLTSKANARRMLALEASRALGVIKRQTKNQNTCNCL